MPQPTKVCVGANAEALLIAASESRELHATLAALPAVYREVVVLRELEGLAYSEIAEIAAVRLEL